MISFLNYEVYLNKFLILSSFLLLLFITLAVIYISYVSWKDKKRLKKNKFCYIYKNDLNLMIFQIGWAALATIFTFSIAMVVWGRNGDGSIDI